MPKWYNTSDRRIVHARPARTPQTPSDEIPF
jgi:hypothetical protein